MFLMFTAYAILGQNDSDDEIVKIMNVSPDGAVVVVVVVVDGWISSSLTDWTLPLLLNIPVTYVVYIDGV